MVAAAYRQSSVRILLLLELNELVQLLRNVEDFLHCFKSQIGSSCSEGRTKCNLINLLLSKPNGFRKLMGSACETEKSAPFYIFCFFCIIKTVFVDQTLCGDLQKKSKDLGKAVKDNCKAARKCK